jgi:hypothetical protein
MLWLGESRGYLADWVTQQWVRITGRRLELEQHPWLRGPVGDTTAIGAGFFDDYARRNGLTVIDDGESRGLLPDMDAVLDSSLLHPFVVRFYECTSDYRMDSWCEWNPWFQPFGKLLAVLFSRRLAQLNVPLSGLDTHRGISSRVVTLRGPAGETETAWVRELVACRRTLYAGSYTSCNIPGHPSPCIKVCFPLPNGRAVVVMRCEPGQEGSLWLASDGHAFGEPGFYFVVERNGRTWARYVQTMKETIHVYAAEEGAVRADHVLRIWGRVFLRLHYRLAPASGGDALTGRPGPGREAPLR